MRIDPTKTQKEATCQVILDILKLSPCYNAFLITADVPEIYMQQFWSTASKVNDSSQYQFQLDNKKFKNGVELFREILRICPRVPNTEFVAPPPHDAIVTFIKSLGYKGSLEFIFDVYTDHMYQPWRTFASIINRCLSGKTLGLDRLRLSRAQILWGLFHKKNVDFAELLWEDFQYQIDYRQTSVRRRESMSYPRFTMKEKKELPPSTSSLSLSSDYGNQFFNVSSNVSLVGIIKETSEIKINSLLDVQIQQEIPHVLSVPLFDVLISVIPPQTTPTPTLTTPLPTPPTTTEAQAINIFVYHSEATEESVQANIINEVKNQLPKFLPKVVSDFVNPRIESTIRKVLQKTPAFLAQSSSTPGQSSYKAVESLSEYELKKILFDKMDRNVNPDKVMRKRDCGNDQDPTAGSNQGKKKRRKGKDSEPSKDKVLTGLSSKGKTQSKPLSTHKPMNAEEPLYEGEMEVEEPTLDDVVNEANQPQDDAIPTQGTQFEQPWFNDLVFAENDPRTFDELMATTIDFSKFGMNRLKLDKITKSDLVGPVYKLLKGTCKSSIKLEYNMDQCYNALTDQLDWINFEGDRYPYDLSKLLPLQGNSERKYTVSITKTKAARSRINRFSKHDVNSTMKILSVVSVKVDKQFRYGYLQEIIVRRADRKLYTFKEGGFPKLHLNYIEYMLLLHVQNKLFNLDGDDIVDLAVALRMFTRRIVIQKKVEDVQLGLESYQKKLNITRPQKEFLGISTKESYTMSYDPKGVMYLNSRKRKRLMPADELYKFSDGTLQSVRKNLHYSQNQRDLPRDIPIVRLEVLRVKLFSIHSDDGNPTSANIKQALRQILIKVEGRMVSHFTNGGMKYARSIDEERETVFSLESSGEFSVKFVRIFIDDLMLPKEEVSTRWVKCIPIKVNIYAWKVYLDKLPTRLNLSLRGIDISFILCPLCCTAVESTSHILFSCYLARQILSKVARWWELEYLDIRSYGEWLSWLNNIRFSKHLKDIFEGVCYFMWWAIWRFRNQILFGTRKPHLEILFDDIVRLSYTWCSSRSNSNFSWDIWMKNPSSISL
ncbi:integrase, catalytic region, zinc finger, CCHC-type containing protein [Tanacetum coccineum]